VDEYLLFHYGDDSDMMPYTFGPKQALQFPSRLAEFSLTHAGSGRGRALDLGCSVGGSAFQLAKHYEQVVGIDFSQHFVDAASSMASKGSADYEILKQGQIFLKRTAKVPANIDRSRVSFQQGDACNLNAATLGTFDLILASNLLCRLPDPKKFLLEISRFLAPGGTLVLVSPYSWLEEYTPVKEWFGGKMSEKDPSKAIDSFEAVKDFIAQNHLPLVMTHKEDIPFLIREHERKFQYGVSDCTVWKKSN